MKLCLIHIAIYAACFTQMILIDTQCVDIRRPKVIVRNAKWTKQVKIAGMKRRDKPEKMTELVQNLGPL